ncbi:hypothetical protein BIV57_07210 [Mangrovactinospora gilvigrisea]|uniref:POTRA domain-containing protein n=1 Tax=Mangrovactinospora gilvigrisea TaxID=1428644 RepID=A0A1J7C9F3_9ACTN|nr:FtsQ-type POTRA domain-containing protein [Mangrovactinospora gilvigrisea]OIV38160.1 hypothetical protein BIV57_07210 [Mangrovactinospora gilvigrisea]
MGTGTRPRAGREREQTKKPPPPRKRGRTRTRPRLRLTRRARLGLLVITLLALLAGAGGVIAYATPLLDFRVLHIGLDAAPQAARGDHRLTKTQIMRAAAVPDGIQLARVDTSAVRERIAVLPRVASVTVTRDWPHTLAISVTERRAVAVLRDADPTVGYDEIDAAGDKFDTTVTRPSGVPQIRMDSGRNVSASYSAAFPRSELLRGAVRVARDLPAAARSRAAWVQVDSYDDITVRLSGKSGNSVVRWGSPERGSQKAAALQALLKKDDSAAVYDVSAPGDPALG